MVGSNHESLCERQLFAIWSAVFARATFCPCFPPSPMMVLVGLLIFHPCDVTEGPGVGGALCRGSTHHQSPNVVKGLIHVGRG